MPEPSLRQNGSHVWTSSLWWCQEMATLWFTRHSSITMINFLTPYKSKRYFMCKRLRRSMSLSTFVMSIRWAVKQSRLLILQIRDRLSYQITYQFSGQTESSRNTTCCKISLVSNISSTKLSVSHAFTSSNLCPRYTLSILMAPWPVKIAALLSLIRRCLVTDRAFSIILVLKKWFRIVLMINWSAPKNLLGSSISISLTTKILGSASFRISQVKLSSLFRLQTTSTLESKTKIKEALSSPISNYDKTWNKDSSSSCFRGLMRRHLHRLKNTSSLG